MLETEKSRERRRETRRKVLIGAYYLDKASKNLKRLWKMELTKKVTQRRDWYLT